MTKHDFQIKQITLKMIDKYNKQIELRRLNTEIVSHHDGRNNDSLKVQSLRIILYNAYIWL